MNQKIDIAPNKYWAQNTKQTKLVNRREKIAVTTGTKTPTECVHVCVFVRLLKELPFPQLQQEQCPFLCLEIQLLRANLKLGLPFQAPLAHEHSEGWRISVGCKVRWILSHLKGRGEGRDRDGSSQIHSPKLSNRYPHLNLHVASRQTAFWCNKRRKQLSTLSRLVNINNSRIAQVKETFCITTNSTINLYVELKRKCNHLSTE